MADHHEVVYGTAEGNDLPAHEATYKTFLSLVKWNLAVAVIVLAGMAIFLT